MAIPLALFALVLGLELSQNKVLLHTTASQLGGIDLERHDYLSVTGGSIALDGPDLPQRVGDTDYVPVFAIQADGTLAATPALIAILPAGQLAGLLQAADTIDAPRRIDLLGMRSATCAALDQTAIPPHTPPLPCLTHGTHPHALTSVLIGSAVLLLPFVGLGLWLWRRRGPGEAPRTLPGWVVKLAKGVMVVLIVGAIALGKMGDALWPAAVKTVAHTAHSAPAATRVLDSVLAYARSEAAAADAINYGYKLASLKKSLDTTPLAPADTLEVQLVQLDAHSHYRRDALGAFRRVRSSALIEYQIRRNGDIVGGQYVATDTADHWPALALRQREAGGPVELLAEQTVPTAKGEQRVRTAGEIAFLRGDAAAYLRGDTVAFRYTAPALRQITLSREKHLQVVTRNPRLSFSMANLYIEATGDTLQVRSTGPHQRIFRP
ncbi:MAG: hypothetical protein DWQ11_14950 [Proteobacteria bacterium]|nr:MAG: hypothetical protein DWQ11_14950 [Pseudomonadota bacterium]